MKFLEDPNARTAKMSDEIIVVMTREEGREIGEALRAQADANKRKRKIKSIADKWDQLAPVFV